MPRIHQLPPDVVNKIAAGEVIERPASVVKELLENAIDAGAKRVDIDLTAGGTERIQVVDDGCGIEPDDFPLVFAAHATSKLASAHDLFRITTLGFRGEALASVASVGQVTLQSRTHTAASGYEVSCASGVLSAVKPWNGAPGTRIEVRHLFYNVPVRKRFLKSVATELGHVCETVTRLALAHPTLHLTLRHNGRLVYDIPASAGLLDRIALFFTAEVRDALYELDSGPGPLRLTGYIADPQCHRGNAKLQYLFVNGRWFRDRSLAHALQESYRGLLMSGRYAVGFLVLTVPPDKLDVNVHPTKAEVRFQENSLVYSLVRSTIKNRLLKENLIPHLTAPPAVDPGTGDEPPPPDNSNQPTAAGASQFFSPRRQLAEQTRAPWERAEPPFPPLPAEKTPCAKETNEPTLPPFVPLPERSGKQHTATTSTASVPEGAQFLPPLSTQPNASSVLPAALSKLPPQTAIQLHDSYIVLETPEGMLVIDQHALHERILFEQLRRRIREGKLEVQQLLIPEPIDLPAEQAAMVLEAAEQLRELGLEVSDFGGNTILLSSYPTLLGRRPPAEILKSVVDHLVTQERPPTKEAMLHLLMATMACKAAVRAGDKLSPEEIAYLLHLRDMAEDSHHCPHGRPTSLLFSRQDLDRQFRRT